MRVKNSELGGWLDDMLGTGISGSDTNYVETTPDNYVTTDGSSAYPTTAATSSGGGFWDSISSIFGTVTGVVSKATAGSAQVKAPVVVKPWYETGTGLVVIGLGALLLVGGVYEISK